MLCWALKVFSHFHLELYSYVSITVTVLSGGTIMLISKAFKSRNNVSSVFLLIFLKYNFQDLLLLANSAFHPFASQPLTVTYILNHLH